MSAATSIAFFLLVFSRYLASLPTEIGNPVFSVYQTDVIHYGRDLRSYFAHEFGRTTYREAITPEPRKIAFWSELVEANNAPSA